MVEGRFTTERDLLEVTLKTVLSLRKDHNRQWINLLEPEGLFGVPDMVLINFKDGHKKIRASTIAFELKLRNWRRALSQAFRYRSFAGFSFVLMDHSTVKPALKNIDAFRKANIGLLSIDKEGTLYLHYRPNYKTPYHPPLHEKLLKIASDELFKIH